ncbi:hypothetical protein BW716_16835 [[Flexibacter] sp. ATCC 35208]|nr:hypothetical protein BW716_16835 [[Flexibacter] sp. ATCC 35208]
MQFQVCCELGIGGGFCRHYEEIYGLCNFRFVVSWGVGGGFCWQLEGIIRVMQFIIFGIWK